MDIGPREIVIIAVVILVLFGSSRIPAVTKSVVESIRQVRGAFKDEDTSTKIAKK